MSWIDTALLESAHLVEWLRLHERETGTIEAIAAHISTGLSQGRRLLTCGNGGSMSDAMHCAEELSGRFRSTRAALAAQAISDPAHLTCVANDYGFEQVFARGVEAWGQPGDVLLVFSTSGRSPNVLEAIAAARRRQMTVVGLLGRDGGTARDLCDFALVVPATDSGRIQEIHIKIVHLLIEAVERHIFPHLPQTQAAAGR